MKTFLLSFLVRATAGYLVLITLHEAVPETLSFLVWLCDKHVIFTIFALFFSLTAADAAIIWIRVNIQHKGVGNKSHHHANTLKD